MKQANRSRVKRAGNCRKDNRRVDQQTGLFGTHDLSLEKEVSGLEVNNLKDLCEFQQEKSRLSASARKERTGKLIAWGVAVEQLILEGSFKEDWWKRHCQLVLSGKTLERALGSTTCELVNFSATISSF